MKPAPFKYIRANSVDEALATLAEHGYDAKILAGGQSLVPSMNFRLLQPAVLVDLNSIKSLNYIKESADGGLRIGAMTRHVEVERSPLVQRLAPLLAETMPHIAHPQIRNRGTIGGSLAHADPAAELPVIAIALDAKLHIRSATGRRVVAARDFFQGTFVVDLEPEEMVVEIELPPWSQHGFAFTEVSRREGDFALAGVAVTLSLDAGGQCSAARIVCLNVGDTPIVASAAAQSLKSTSLNDQAIAHAARVAAQDEIDPLGSIHASAEFQRHLILGLTKRALTIAHGRAAAYGRAKSGAA